MVREFVFPANKDELLQQNHTGQYFVEKIVPPRMLAEALDVSRTALQANGSCFILEHFDTFFTVMVHGNKLDLVVVMRAFNRILKAVEALVQELEELAGRNKDIRDEERVKLQCINKMLAYLLSWYMCYIEDEILKNSSETYTGKRKKVTKTDAEAQWDDTKEKALEIMYRWLQFPLQTLWQPPIIEDEFIALLAKVCYKILEEAKDAKQKQLRETIFRILGTSIKKYSQGISSVIRIIQLVKLHDILAAQIGNGIIIMVTECGCSGLIRELMKEIGQSELSEAAGRNISIFLETIANNKPDVIIPILDDVTDYLASEHYSMRNCALGILTTVVQKALTGEELTSEQRHQRDECLDILIEHLIDSNAYVRSKVLQLWLRLCSEGAIPLSRQGQLLAATALRLEDKSAIVRKHSLQLIRALLQSNPFAAKLNKEDLSKSLAEEEAKLKQIQIDLASRSARGDTQRLDFWNTLLPKIKDALKEIVESNNNNDDDENDNDSDDEEVNPDTGFEHIRQLMLKERVLEAVKYLWKMCIMLNVIPDIENLAPEAKEECLFLLLLKTFMESEGDSDKSDKNQTNSKSSDDTALKEELRAKQQVVTYFKNCLEFATELQNTMPIVKILLFSTTATDAIEACTLLGTASQFGVVGAAASIREALFQVFHRDPSVRNNVAQVYKEIYLNIGDDHKGERQKAQIVVKALIELITNLKPGQSPALAQLIISWYKNEEINSVVLQILWEKFSMKSPETTALDSRAALMLITMIGQAQSGVITGNLEVLIKVGLGERAKTDLLLARDTCRALLKIKQDASDIGKPALRYLNDHEIFKHILGLLENNFLSDKEDGYISFATDAINVVYHLADQPESLMKELLASICRIGNFTVTDSSEEITVPFFILSKLLYLIGHIAIKQMVHLDTAVYKELKRRDVTQKQKSSNKVTNKTPRTSGVASARRPSGIVSARRPSGIASATRTPKAVSATRTPKTVGASRTPMSAGQTRRNKESSIIAEDNGEEAVEGAQEDADAEFINATLETEVITGDGLLTKFLPLVLDVCQYPDKYNNANLQAAGALALCKMMTVSSSFCEESLQLLVTILEVSPHPGIRSNILIGLGDLSIRFPNEVEPWMKHVYTRLRDEDVGVRKTCVHVLSNLIMGEMVRVKGQISELALCIVDKDSQIRQDTKEFFQELAQKGNALYNVIPDILSRLTDPELDLNENDFHEILKHILSQLQKEKHVDAVIEKICARFALATTERQWRDFAYCLSLLQFSEKSIRRLIESLPLLKHKIHNVQVQKALQNVIEQTSKKPNAKAACAELESKLQELLTTTENTEKTDNEAMPPPPVPKARKHRKSRRRSSSDEEDEDFENDPEATPGGKARERKKRRLHERTNNPNSDTDSDTEEAPPKTPLPQSARKSKTRKKQIDSSSEAPVSKPKKSRQNVTPSPRPQRTSARLSQSRMR